MRHKGIDKEQKVLFAAAVIVILLTIFIAMGLSRMAVHNVDTKKGVSRIKELEKTDTAEIESQINAIETKEKQAGEEWKNRSLSEKFANAVIMGDSITSGFNVYEVLDTSKVVAEKGVHLNQLDGLIQTVVNLNPQVLFLALGLNDVSSTAGDTAAFAAAYQIVIDTLQTRLPNTKLYVNGILPVKESVVERNPVYAKIPDYNTALRNLCESEGLTFIDNTKILKDEYYEQDGEHMKKIYYPVWGEHMAEVAGI